MEHGYQHLWAIGFMRRGVPFRSPTPPSLSHGRDFLNIKINSPACLVVAPLLWDMEDLYGNTKEP
jgi:hypothetical protein